MVGMGTRYWFSASVESKEWKPSRANVKERREEKKDNGNRRPT